MAKHTSPAMCRCKICRSGKKMRKVESKKFIKQIRATPIDKEIDPKINRYTD